ncbi:hypothetical protein Fot_52448 [Forsythia ovata]|uniref:Uncharacterized protein n=1 Tax=Forsythia ovata TaxID=205694 RepID=A0ABD1PKR4_9LAMI
MVAIGFGYTRKVSVEQILNTQLVKLTLQTLYCYLLHHLHPSPKKRLRPPPPKNSISEHRDHNHQDSLKNLTPAKTKKLNEGKKIGLIFVGVVAILQDEIALRRRCLLHHLHYLSVSIS